ncbi:hypothetical protein NPX13_g9516 [Xylaria arbuscula]|uniref:Uncharacterized protein n=1 Tax=Xylaria arbuscula TaxID=114810 RepID=A0A9W8THE8_9PEZI|nr:hypothetical protein NPX13_g9516 [Xylaria arbuscula]
MQQHDWGHNPVDSSNIIIYILLIHLAVEFLAILTMAAHLCPQLRFAPGIVLTPQKGRVDLATFARLIPYHACEVGLQRAHGLCFRQVPPDALEERHAEPLTMAREDPVRRRLAQPTGDNLKSLPNVHDKSPFLDGYVDPRPGFVKDLETFNFRGRGLQEEGPPPG